MFWIIRRISRSSSGDTFSFFNRYATRLLTLPAKTRSNSSRHAPRDMTLADQWIKNERASFGVVGDRAA